MSDPLPPSPGASEVQAQLRSIAQILHQHRQLGPDAQELLAKLVEEMSDELGSRNVSAQELNHLAEAASHLLQTIKQPQEPRKAASARDRLEAAISRIESEHPTVAGIARRFVDALGELGI